MRNSVREFCSSTLLYVYDKVKLKNSLTPKKVQLLRFGKDVHELFYSDIFQNVIKRKVSCLNGTRVQRHLISSVLKRFSKIL